jgi:cytochrome c-type biogenesis protein CcmH
MVGNDPRSPQEDGRQAARVEGGATSRPRGIRTTILSLVTLAALAAIIIGVLIASLNAPQGSAPGMSGAAESAGTTDGGAGRGPTIAGRISVAPELAGRIEAAHVLFIIARRGAGPPFAVKRIADPHLPLRYRLGAEDVMMAGTPFAGEVTMVARLSLAGGAGPAQPGDMEGEHPGKVSAGAQDADIVINQVN